MLDSWLNGVYCRRMDINFDNTYNVLDSPLAPWMFIAFSVGVIIVVASTIFFRKRKKSAAELVWNIAGLVVMVGAIVLLGMNITSVFNNQRAIVKDAAQQAYGIELSKQNLVDINALKVREMPSDEFTLFGTTTLVIDGDIVEVKLVWNEGEYQLVVGESSFKELNRVD